MPSTQEFRRRIKSVNNTKQITKAMEMVASVKMQKAVRTIHEARTYVQNSWNMLVRLANTTLPENHLLLKPVEINRTAVIFVTSDRGLCGSYNADLYKKLVNYCSSVSENLKNSSQTSSSNNSKTPSVDVDIIAIGRKGADFVRRHNVGNLVAVYDGFENDIDFEDIIPISKMTNGEYLNGKYDKVVVMYSNFITSLRQAPVVKQILPIDKDHIDIEDIWENLETDKEDIEYKIEPNSDQVLEKLLRRFIRLQIFGAVLEANASEHSSRMVAMKNASDNSDNLIEELTLTYNTIRQNGITSEIAEITAGAEAMA